MGNFAVLVVADECARGAAGDWALGDVLGRALSEMKDRLDDCGARAFRVLCVYLLIRYNDIDRLLLPNKSKPKHQLSKIIISTIVL